MLATTIELLSYGFMQRAVLAGLLIALAAGIMGVFAIIRKGAFFGDAIAHSSLAGVAFGVLLNFSPLIGGAIYAIIAAITLPLLQKRSHLALDTILGILLPVSMGLSVIIFSLLPGYQPELLSFLFGNILSVNTNDLLLLLVVVAAILVLLYVFLDQLLLTSIDEIYAKVTGVNVGLINIIYHLLLALSIIAGVKLVGVILVNALLVIPASIALQFSRSLKSQLILTPVVSVAVVLLGILASAAFNSPSGATIALVGGVAFGLSLILRNAFN